MKVCSARNDELSAVYTQMLDLRNNRITTLSGRIFLQNMALTDVKLAQNRWNCNCQLLEFVQ